MDAKDVIIHDSSEDTRPERYGRTLARDAETLQRGGIPDMAPLSQSAAKERLVAGSPLAPPVPTAPPAASPPPPPRAHTLTPPLVTPIETYAGDFLDMVKKTNASSATVLAAEQDKEKRSPVPQVPQERSRGNLLYVIAGAVLLVAGVAGAYAAYSRYLSALAPVASILGVSAPIFIDEREQISGSSSAIFKAVEASIARPPATGAVRLLYGATATTSIVATLLAKAPDIVRRNMNANNSMAGIVNAGGSASPFFILSVSSYGNTFSGMLWWEKTIVNDLLALWGGARPSATTSSTVATTSPPVSEKAARGTAVATASTSSGQATTAARATGFRDEVIGNHDARVYRDEAGRSVLLYGYWDKTTLIIARDPGAFIEILQRFAASRAQ